MLQKIIILFSLLASLWLVSCAQTSMRPMPLSYLPPPINRENYAHLEANPTKKESPDKLDLLKSALKLLTQQLTA
ncbi:hypothetical protein THII_1757 [Thioploca ingrica]|uniref:Lipoprotein n=1 Tax=Thioploca ingrica TaxID=40754 RepID=A0A090AG13_9GAMM|nr:hypothetical protein THII_1757 [Thioploca ingrica]